MRFLNYSILFLLKICTVSQLFWNRVCKTSTVVPYIITGCLQVKKFHESKHLKRASQTMHLSVLLLSLTVCKYLIDSLSRLVRTNSYNIM